MTNLFELYLLHLQLFFGLKQSPDRSRVSGQKPSEESLFDHAA